MSSYEVAKRIFDFSIAVLSGIFLLPVYLLCAIAIKLDSPGPILYKQERVGKNGKIFWMFRFRTMYVAADSNKINTYVSGLVSDPNDKKDGWYRKNDPRVTRVGRVFRRYSFNELPLMFNVLTGEMSIVGPRPVLPFEAERYPEELRERFKVMPGITGLAQIQMYDHSFEQMVKKDIEYVYRKSLLLDIEIILRTIPAVLGNHGAY
jgi:lipopolysaccharide/colanic/teichoic acid biosynthesis glycosyltransferase